MREPGKISFKFILAMVAAGALFFAAFIWYGQNSTPGESVAGASTGRIRVDAPEPGHLDLLFSERGEVSYQFFGQEIGLYLAQYRRDELVLHERVGGISTTKPTEFSGSVIWGVALKKNRRSEIRARIGTDFGTGHGYFDVSQIDFNPAIIGGTDIGSGKIQPGERYVLQTWQSGNTIWAVDNDIFNPASLRDNEQTIVLYLIFE